MMMLLLACTLSLAGPDVSAAPNPDAKDTLDEPVDLGSLVIDARVPVEVLVDGHKMVQLYTSGHVKLNVAPGHRRLRIYVNGTPEEHAIEILPTGAALVIVGRTGITTGQTSPAVIAQDGTLAQIRFRSVGAVASQIRLGERRIMVQPDEIQPVEMAPGKHNISIRSSDGTAIWATGVLTLDGGEVVIQIAEGRLPEVTGDGRFTARGR